MTWRDACRRTVVAVAGSLVVLATSCRGSGSLPASPGAVEVTMREYSFTVPASTKEGRTVFRVTNEGQLPHQLTLQLLPDDFPPMFEQLRSDIARSAQAVVLMRDLHPGESDTFAVDLVPGRYGVVSFTRDAEGVTDAEKGMGDEFFVK